jgi:hypothetical protein
MLTTKRNESNSHKRSIFVKSPERFNLLKQLLHSIGSSVSEFFGECTEAEIARLTNTENPLLDLSEYARLESQLLSLNKNFNILQKQLMFPNGVRNDQPEISPIFFAVVRKAAELKLLQVDNPHYPKDIRLDNEPSSAAKKTMYLYIPVEKHDGFSKADWQKFILLIETVIEKYAVEKKINAIRLKIIEAEEHGAASQIIPAVDIPFEPEQPKPIEESKPEPTAEEPTNNQLTTQEVIEETKVEQEEDEESEALDQQQQEELTE